MPNFPVELGDPQGIVEAVNYALSGPSGLGQNISGLAFSQPAGMIGAARLPHTRRPQASSEATGAQGAAVITCFAPENIRIGQYVEGIGIAAGTQVAGTYNPATPSSVPLTIANTGPVTAIVNFYEYNGPDNLNVTPIALASAVQLDSNTVQFTFAAPQPSPPFRPNQIAAVAGVSVAAYNIFYTAPGVVECTTTTVTVRSFLPLGTLAAGTGGTIRSQATVAGPAVGVSTVQNRFYSTDMQREVGFNSVTDRLIVSATLENTVSWTSPGTVDLLVRTVLVRLSSFATTDFGAAQAGLLFEQQSIVAEQNTIRTLSAGTGSFTINTNFGTVVDTPPSAGLYLYRVALQFRNITALGSAQVTSSVLGPRSISTQVVKL